MIYFTSDTHLGHSNIIKYCNRPFRDRKEMNETIIRNWNSVVKEEDQVYHLGDVSFLNNDWTNSILRALHGVIYHIKGNHDKKLKTDRFVWSKEFEHIYVNDRPNHVQSIFLSHHYLPDWPRKAEGGWHLHGHAHGTVQSPNMLRLDVGVDLWDFTPIHLKTIQAYFDGLIEPKWASKTLTEYRRARGEG